MNVRFYVSGFRNLEVEMDGERETMIAPHFMLNANKSKAADYLRGIATDLTSLYNTGQVDAAGDLLEKTERVVDAAETAEKFCEEVIF